MFVNEDNQQVYEGDNMVERKIVINAHGEEKDVPYPFANPEIRTGRVKRPTIRSYEEALEWNKQAQEYKDKSLGFTQPFAEVEVFPKDDNKILFMLLSDTHWGHYDTDYNEVDRLFKILEETPNAYAFFGWNLLDAAIPAQFPDGQMWSGQTAQEQTYTFRDKLRRLHKLNKILGGIGSSSCHEGWMKKKTGWMIYKELFEGIDVPLLDNGGYLNIKVGEQVYKTAHFHKIPYYSSLNKAHGGERAMDRLADVEIVTTSHYHTAVAQQSQRYNPPFEMQTAVLASGTCKLNDKWSRDNLGRDGEKPGQSLILWADKHKFQAIFDIDAAVELMK